MIKGIIFDMDGVLCDSEAFICEAAIRFLNEAYGVEAHSDEFLPFVGMGEDRYLGGVAEAHGITLSLVEDKIRLYTIYLEIIKGRMLPVDGVYAFIKGARASGKKLAVATSADLMKMEGNLKELGLPPESFDACVKGDDVERKKPAPDVFLLAADRIGLAPEDCLVVEDAINGIQAAKTAGCRCLALTTSFDAEMLMGAGADWVAEDFSSVPTNLLLQL